MKQSKIDKTLYRLGVNTSYRGFRQASYCISLFCDHPEYQDCLKIPYIAAAQQFQTSPDCIERNIRTLANVIWNRGNRQLLQEIADRTLTKPPTGREFLVMMANYIQTSD
jgi:hypothetical protein